MTELEQLRADLAMLEAAQETINQIGRNRFPSNYWREIKEFAIVSDLKKRIADLEAQVDEWADVKAILNRWCFDRSLSGESYRVYIYVCHLQAKVAGLENELRCERIDGGKVRDDRKAISAEKNREKLAELTTILNAIPPACGLARELVEWRIESVKREMQR